MEIADRVRAIFARAKRLKLPYYFLAHHLKASPHAVRNVLYKGRKTVTMPVYEGIERMEKLLDAVEKALNDTK